MKKLFLTTEQAEVVARDLLEYSKFGDSSQRRLFKGFEINFGDLMAQGLQDDAIKHGFSITPIPEFIEL